MTSNKVLVGIDGSEHGTKALAWALERQSSFGPIEPIMVYQPHATLEWMVGSRHAVDSSILRQAAESALARAIAAVGQEGLMTGRVVEGRPGPTLVDLAEDAALLVLGTRGRGGLWATLLGSVGSHCARYATVPVIVVPDNAESEGQIQRVVVGVDGSGNAERALCWALEHVAPGGTIYAVGALSAWSSIPGELDPPVGHIEQQVRAAVENAIALVAEKTTWEDGEAPEIVIQVCKEDARMALRKMASENGDLLVIGARGLTGLTQLVLGSVADALVHHPTVPTVIIPSTTPATSPTPTPASSRTTTEEADS